MRVGCHIWGLRNVSPALRGHARIQPGTQKFWQALPHVSGLFVFLDDGMRLTVRPNQGMGYWSTKCRVGSSWGVPPLDFGAPPKQQGERIANLAVAVQGQPFPTHRAKNEWIPK